MGRNAETTIADTIRSVSAQDYPDLEHIIIDGASTDGTLAVIEAHAHSGLRIHSERDSGIYDAMNKGVAAASGDLIGFLNADDFLCRKDAITLIARGARKGSSCAVGGAVAIVDPKALRRVVRAYPARGFSPWMMRFGHMPPHPAFYARAEAFRKVGLFDSAMKIGGDFEWMVRFFHSHRLKATFIRETLVTMRHGGISTGGIRNKILLNREANRSLRAQGFHSHEAVLWLKYLTKSAQWIAPAADYPPPHEVRWRP